MTRINYKYNYTGLTTAAVLGELLFWALFAGAYFLLMQIMPGLKLQRPWLLYFLAIGPLMMILFLVTMSWKNRSLDRFSNEKLLGFLVPDVSTFRSGFKFLLLRFGLASIILALANPQSGSKLANVKAQGIDIMIALDVSNSMHAEDIVPSRLIRSKRAIEQLLDKLGGDRVGIIVFAGQAFVQLPITNDYNAAKLFLSTINTDIVPVQGTAIGAAIDLATQSFDKESATQKAVIIITDGENHEDDALTAVKKAKESGIRIFTIGMGSPEGAPIPEYNGRRKIGYKKDKQGATVISRLNETILRQLASEGNGIFVRATSAQAGLEILLEEINKIEKTEYGSVTYSDYEDQYHPFLLAGMLMILIEFLIPDRKGKLARKFDIFKVG